MRAFLTNTPQVVMEIPVAPITDDREHMIMRAICDERISLPLDAFKDHPEIYQQIVDILPPDQLMDVKVAWRCNTTQYWHAAVDAGNLSPFGGHLGEEPAYSGHPNPGAGQSSHSLAPFIAIEGDDGKDYEAERKPPITVNNVVSACGKDYMKKSYGVRFGPEQCQPLGNDSEREGGDTRRLLLQMVQRLLERKDGELPLSSDHLGKCGPSDGSG